MDHAWLERTLLETTSSKATTAARSVGLIEAFLKGLIESASPWTDAASALADPHFCGLLGALERALLDPRRTVSLAAYGALGAVPRDRAVWELAVAQGFHRIAEHLAPDDAREGDALDDTVRRLLARGQGPQLRDMAPRLGAAELLELVGIIHDRLGDQVDTRADTVAEALADLVSHADDVVRFAAIDALAMVGHHACDLSVHVPALVVGLEHRGKIAFAPGSGTWWTSGLAESSQRALGHAVRWPASHALAVSALEATLTRRSKTVAGLAAGALSWGLARCGNWEAVAGMLSHPDPAVTAAALWGLSDQRPTVEVPEALQERVCRLRADPNPAIAKAAIKVAGKLPGPSVTATTVNLEDIAKGLISARLVDRREAAGLLYPYRENGAAMRSVLPYLISGLGFDTREDVLGLLLPSVAREFTDAEVERLAPIFGGLLLDGDYRSSGARQIAYVCLRNVKAPGISLKDWEPIAAAVVGRAL